MDTVGWNRVVRLVVLAIHTTLMRVSTQSISLLDDYHSIKSSDNVDLCATSIPSLVMPTRSKIDCLRQCQGQTVARCDGVNYDRTSNQCNIFFIRPREYITNMTSCQYLRRRSNEPCYNNPPTIIPINDQSQCSFPFTYNGQLYYNCATNSSWSNLYNCQQFYCRMVNGTAANCLPPADFVAKVEKYTVNVSGLPDQPTFSVYGWIAFMLRKLGSGDGKWNLPWVNYTNGFGFNDSYLWLGLERVHQLTTVGNWRMRLEYFYSGKWVSAEYWTFTLGDSSTFYTIQLSGYNGDDGNLAENGNGNSAHAFDGMKFSTFDKDNDRLSGGSCSTGTGWWLNVCGCLVLTETAGLQLTLNGGGSWIVVSEVHMMMKVR